MSVPLFPTTSPSSNTPTGSQQSAPTPDPDWPHCEALNGLGPHDYIFQIDLVAGKSILYCRQCRDVHELARLQPGQPLPTP